MKNFNLDYDNNGLIYDHHKDLLVKVTDYVKNNPGCDLTLKIIYRDKPSLFKRIINFLLLK